MRLGWTDKHIASRAILEGTNTLIVSENTGENFVVRRISAEFEVFYRVWLSQAWNAELEVFPGGLVLEPFMSWKKECIDINLVWTRGPRCLEESTFFVIKVQKRWSSLVVLIYASTLETHRDSSFRLCGEGIYWQGAGGTFCSIYDVNFLTSGTMWIVNTSNILK